MIASQRARVLFAIAFLFCAEHTHGHAETPAPLSSTEGAVTLHSALSHSSYTKAAPKSLLLKIDYAAASAKSAAERPPLNIALVLDHSGSMAEARKLPYTIEAAREVIANMTERDVLSIVVFNNKVTVLSPAGRVVNKAFLLHRLDEVAPGGYTDISAGLLEGISQIDSQRAEGQLQQVLLLTDGIANRGLITAEALSKVAAKAHARGIGISTFGCGTEFNEKPLAEMANAGGGRYTYVKAPEEIPTAFVEELHGLLEAAAQNTAIEATVTGGQIKRINGRPVDPPVASYKFEIGNLRAGERGVVLLDLAPSSFENGAALSADVRLTFDDPEAGQRLTQSTASRATITADGDQLGPNAEVVIYGAVLNALEQAEQAAKGLDLASSHQAHAAFDQVYEPARQQAIASNDQELLNQTFMLKHFMEELALAEKQNLLHQHKEARGKLAKEAHYQEYLLKHHRPQSAHD